MDICSTEPGIRPSFVKTLEFRGVFEPPQTLARYTTDPIIHNQVTLKHEMSCSSMKHHLVLFPPEGLFEGSISTQGYSQKYSICVVLSTELKLCLIIKSNYFV
jgi:hypothetical protein